MRTQLFSATVMAFAIGAAVCGQSTSDMPRGEYEPLFVDSGLRPGPADAPATVYQDLVHAGSAAWLRLYFNEATELQKGSFIRLTSLQDNEVQVLDAGELARWNHTSAYFNGDTLLVELVAGPNTRRNRIVIDEIALEIGVALPAGSCGICGADNRVPSDEDWSGRLLPAGCTASVWNEFSCLVSAGHCIGGGMTIQFRVPDSDPDCSLNHPPVADQFPITQFEFNNGGVGADWAVMLTTTNNLGETIIERYGEFRPIASSPPGTGQSLNIWGFGVDSQCTRSQRQQTSGGQVTNVSSTLFNHNVDATFGNSGSAVIRNGTILGIATHCPCNNVATRIDLPVFANARANLCSDETACCFIDGSCLVLSFDDCAAASGQAQGVGTDCDMVGLCPEGFGACCYPGDICVQSTQTDCVDSGGTFQGFEVACEIMTCTVPTGACCIGGGCVVVPGADCATFGGLYQGDSTVCGGNICGDATGECCFSDGACSEETDADCVNSGGEYQGDGGNCNPNQCPQPPATGACCFTDGSCNVQTQADCGSAGGAYTGDDTSCSPNDCPQPPATGACCSADGSCNVQTQADCVTAGGAYSGDDTSCSPNDCPQPPDCPADIDGNLEVDFQDLLALLAAWGGDGAGADIAEPLDLVDFQDLLGLLATWGPCE